jgi:hypothetical protein
MPITTFYAALLALIFVALSLRTISARRAARVEIGDGDDRELLRRMRVHANFAEYVPIAVILLALAETMKLQAPLLHGIGALLLAGRASHAYALSQSPHILPLRVAGMIATLTAIIAAAAACLVLAVPALY